MKSSEVLITETYEANYSRLWSQKALGGTQTELATKWLAAGVERLMRELGIKGAIRGKGIVITTIGR